MFVNYVDFCNERSNDGYKLYLESINTNDIKTKILFQNLSAHIYAKALEHRLKLLDMKWNWR